MKNKYFPEEEITWNDVYFVCYMVERVSRSLHQHNRYTVNAIGYDELWHLLSVAAAQHCENPLAVEADWIDRYQLQPGAFDITQVDPSLVESIPSPTQIGKVYLRLIQDTLAPDEDYATAILRVYNDSICDVIDNYNASAYYEPSYVIARAYNDGEF